MALRADDVATTFSVEGLIGGLADEEVAGGFAGDAFEGAFPDEEAAS